MRIKLQRRRNKVLPRFNVTRSDAAQNSLNTCVFTIYYVLFVGSTKHVNGLSSHMIVQCHLLVSRRHFIFLIPSHRHTTVTDDFTGNQKHVHSYQQQDRSTLCIWTKAK